MPQTGRERRGHGVLRGCLGSTSGVGDEVAVESRRNCLVTGGGNHSVCFWDYKSKKRITQITAFDQPIAALAFNTDGSKLAIASSYLYENGKEE